MSKKTLITLITLSVVVTFLVSFLDSYPRDEVVFGVPLIFGSSYPSYEFSSDYSLLIDVLFWFVVIVVVRKLSLCLELGSKKRVAFNLFLSYLVWVITLYIYGFVELVFLNGPLSFGSSPCNHTGFPIFLCLSYMPIVHGITVVNIIFWFWVVGIAQDHLHNRRL